MSAIQIDLPESIRAVVSDVVRLSRLWIHEKADVAGELSAHFQDGLSTNRTPEELIETFGPTKTAACLIRRARLRCRPWTWQLWRRTWQFAACAAGAALMFWSFLIFRFDTAKPTITFDLVQQIDTAAAGIPAADRAWPLYREGLLNLGPTQVEAFSGITDDIAWTSVALGGPESVDWPRVKQFLRTHRESLDLFLEAAERPRLGFQHRAADNAEWVRWSKSGSDATEYNPPGTIAPRVLLAHIQELRAVAALIIGRMWAGAESDEAGVAIRCFAAVLKLRDHVREDGLAISTLCGQFHVQAGCKCLSSILQTWPELFDEMQLQDLSQQLKNQLTVDWAIDVASEQQMFMNEFFEHAYASDGRFTPQGFRYLKQIGRAVHTSLLSFVPATDEQAPALPLTERLLFEIRGSELAAWIAGRAEMDRKFAELRSLYIDACRDPDAAAEKSAFTAELNRLNASWMLRRKYLPVLIMFQGGILDRSSLQQGSQIGAMHVAIESAMVAVARERYRRVHGDYPQQPSDLLPDFLDVLPVED